MKLRNKLTGEIGLVHCDATMFSNKIGVFIDNNHIDLRNPYKIYTSLAELNEEWEDCVEPKEYWYLENNGDIDKEIYDGDNYEERMIEIGNYFDTLEEAEQAVEKLKAWKRLVDKGFRFTSWTIDDGLRVSVCTNFDSDGIYDEDRKEAKKDLDICFGGEE